MASSARKLRAALVPRAAGVFAPGTGLVLDRGVGGTSGLAAGAFAARIQPEAGYDSAALASVPGRRGGRSAQGGFPSRHPPAAERVAALGPVALAAAPPPARLTRLSRAVASLGQ
ncbi:MAG TPA: hypothetical protein VFL83_20445 [Anaeromyxobacter sp.]|nr:hypothetical protein [Anaeromyxobacter sp.]